MFFPFVSELFSRCYNGGLQHYYLPRYTEEPIKQRIEMEGSIEDIRSLMVMKVYVGDVCKWCGRIFERRDQGDENH